MPRQLRFNHNGHNDSGTLSWIGSKWVPGNPTKASAFTYEVRVIYPHRTFGPYVVSGNRYTISNLDSRSYPRLSFTVTTVGLTRLGQHEYRYKSEVAELDWTKPGVTVTPDISKLEVLFRVVSNGQVNIRSCPETSCNPPMGMTRRSGVYEVIGLVSGKEGDWFQIIFENQIAYVAGWLRAIQPIVPTVMPTNTVAFTPTTRPKPSPTLSPTSNLDYSLSAPGDLESAVSKSGVITVAWSESEWRPAIPADEAKITYEVKIVNAAGSSGVRRISSRPYATFSDIERYTSKRIRFRVEAVAELQIGGQRYSIRSKAAEGAELYVPAFDFMLQKGVQDSRLPGYCDIKYTFRRGGGYELSVAYNGKTYNWYRVDIIDPDGNLLNISSSRKTGNVRYQRYSNTLIEKGLYTARTRELNPSRRKTFAFQIEDEGNHTLTLLGSGC